MTLQKMKAWKVMQQTLERKGRSFMEKKKTETEKPVVRKPVIRYKGTQLLKMAKYKSLPARVVIKPNEHYSFDEADKLISDFMKKKG